MSWGHRRCILCLWAVLLAGRMGCGASAQPKDDGNDPEPDHAEPKAHTSHDRSASRASRHESYATTNAVVDGDDDNEDNLMVTQAVMAELRVKSKDHHGSSVQRWIDAIAEPNDTDAADMYDPMRRHFLAMESLQLRFKGNE